MSAGICAFTIRTDNGNLSFANILLDGTINMTTVELRHLLVLRRRLVPDTTDEEHTMINPDELQVRRASVEDLDIEHGIVEVRLMTYEHEAELETGLSEVFTRGAFAAATKNPIPGQGLRPGPPDERGDRAGP